MYVHDGYDYFCLFMKYRILLFAVCLSTLLHAQKFDYVWIIGDNNQTTDTTHGGAIIDFNQMPVKAKYHYRDMNMFVCNVSICDNAGNLQFYTNGCAIAGADDTILPNGDNLNPGPLHYIDCVQNMDGYASNHQSAVILPLPETQGIYYLFHKSQSIVYNPTVITTDKLLYSIVDMNANNGKGEVIEKNSLVMFDSLAYGEMNAVKHANGEDWWIITPRESSNQFYIFLFTKDGIVDTLTQTIGEVPSPDNEGYGQTTFSPIGDKMIRFYPHEAIGLYHFDRSIGFFTGYDTIHIDFGNFISFDGGCAVSPNGRYLYVTAVTKAYQFDLWASDISATQTTIATWDGFKDPIAISFWLCQLGPDCKIYVIGGGDTRYYHIIHNPDEPGLACNFEQRGLVLPTPSGASIPYFPNYRLGPIDNPGVPCTATVSVSPPLVQPLKNTVQLWPNPATERITIGFAFTDASVTHQVLLTNAVGQVVGDFQLSGAEGEMNVSIAHMPTGIYYYTVSGSYAPGTSGKLFINR
jgi:hypothetical protein